MKSTKENIKILYILPAFNITGGIESYVVNYFSHFSNNICADFIVHDCQDNYYKNIVESRGSNVYVMPKIGVKSFFSFMKELKKFFKCHHDYDIIHCNMANAALFYFSEAKKYRIPIKINHSHQHAYADTLSHSLRNIPLIKIGARMANVNFACSKIAGDFLFKKQKYYIINNAIDFEKFKFDFKSRTDIRKKYNISDDIFLIGNVGRLVPVKNQLFLVEIMREIVNIDKNVRLMIIGDGDLRKKLEDKINEYNLQEYIMLLNGKSDINRYYSAFDCFVLPSIYEGLGFVNIEAQVSGLEVIVSTGVSLEAKITDHFKFLNLDIGPKNWAEQILSVKNDERHILKEEIYDSGFDIEKEAKKLEDLYFKLKRGIGE